MNNLLHNGFKTDAIYFKIGIVLFIVSLVAGIVTYNPLFFILPIAYLFFLLSIPNISRIYLLLMVFIPISIEYNFSPSLGTDLPTEPIVVFLFVFFIFFLFSNKEKILLEKPLWNHPIILIIFLGFVVSFISTLFSNQHILSIKYLIAKTWYLAVYLLFSYFFLTSIKKFYKLLWILILVTFFSILYVWYNHAHFSFVFDAINRSVVPIYRNHVNYGVFISAILPFQFLLRYRSKKGSIERLFLDISIIISFFAIYFSYTRGAWLALVLCLPVILAVHFRKIKSLLFIAITTVFISLGYLSYDNKYLNFAPEYRETIYHEDFSDHMAATFELTDMSTVERFYRWIAGIRMIKDNYLVGVGPGNFVDTYKPYTVNEFVTYISENEEQSTIHNYFLYLFVEQGFLAFVLFIVLMIFVFHTIQKLYHKREHNNKSILLAISGCLTILYVNNFFSDLIEADKVGPLFFICIAMLLRLEVLNLKETYNKEY